MSVCVLACMWLQGLSLGSWLHLSTSHLPNLLSCSLVSPIVPALKTMYRICLHHNFFKILPLPDHPETEEIPANVTVTHLNLKLSAVPAKYTCFPSPKYPFSVYTINYFFIFLYYFLYLSWFWPPVSCDSVRFTFPCSSHSHSPGTSLVPYCCTFSSFLKYVLKYASFWSHK